MASQAFGDQALGLLAAFQLADSFFPSGAFAQSHGLEAMYRRGQVKTAHNLSEFLEAQLRWSVLPSDGVALLNAKRSVDANDLATVFDIDRLLLAIRVSSELRRASCHIGKRLLDEMFEIAPEPILAAYRGAVVNGDSPGNAAVAWGVIARVQGFSAQTAMMAFCHGYVVGVLGAALRLLPVSHRDTQAILHRLGSTIVQGIREIEDQPWQEMRSFSPQLDVASMMHETDSVRMFAS